jgi:hypothetical protein
VLVGIGEYDSKPLTTPYSDIENMTHALSRGGYHIETLMDSQATADNIIDEINNKLINKADSDDVSLFYYTGHGTQKPTINSVREGNEANDECLSVYDGGIIRDDTLTDLIAEIPGEVIVILDTCKSRGFFQDLDYIIESHHRIVMFAAHDDGQSLYGIPMIDHGLLSFAIINGLMGDTEGNSYTNVEECYDNARSFYNTCKEAFKVGYEDGVQVYPLHPCGMMAFNRVKDIKIISNFNNKQPDIDFDFSERNGNVEITATLSDPDNDKLDFFILWQNKDSFPNTGWLGKFNSGDEITKSHKYSKNGEYKIYMVARDEHGACSGWKILTIDIKSKTKPLNYLNIDRFEFLKEIFSMFFDEVKFEK